MEPIETNANIALSQRAKKLQEKIESFETQILGLEKVISYLEQIKKNPTLNKESRDTIEALLEEKKTELASLELEYNEKNEKLVTFVDDKSDDEATKSIRKEVEELYNSIMKVKYYVPGYLYSNEEEYNRLDYAMDAYNITALDLLVKMAEIEEDLKAVNAEAVNPTMTKDEKELYFELSKVIWTMAAEKEKDPRYIYTNVAKSNSLLAEYERIKTNNPHITEMIYIITKDIKKAKEKTEGKVVADEYQQKLDGLKIKSPLAGAPDINTLPGKVEDVTKPDTKGIKSKRKAGEAEKAAASDSKKKAKRNGIKLLSYVLPAIMAFGPALWPVIGIAAILYQLYKDIRSGAWSNTFTNIKEGILNIGPWMKEKAASIKEKHDTRKDRRERIKAERKLRKENINAIRRGIYSDPNSGEDVEDEIEDEIEEPEAEAETHSRGGM